MAKLRPSIIKIQGSIFDVTMVHSRRYGLHARARRGTITPVTINDELKKSSARLADSNKPARLIFDAIRDEHKDGGLWTDLLSIFRKQIREGKSFSLEGLNKLECSQDHPLHKLMHSLFTVDVATSEDKMDITVTLEQHPKWDKKGYLDGYQLSVVAVFPDFEQDHFTRQIARSPIINFKDEVQPLHFTLPMPSSPTPWLIFMGVTGCERGKLLPLPHLKGMAVVKVMS